MLKLSHSLIIAALVSLAFAAWSFVTFPIIKFGTETVVRGRLTELVDRDRLTEEERESLDLIFEFLISNDRQWKASHDALHTIALSGFLLCSLFLCWAAYQARRLENRFKAPLTTV